MIGGDCGRYVTVIASNQYRSGCRTLAAAGRHSVTAMTDKQMVYQTVAARRLQWDILVWQVPVLSLTGRRFCSRSRLPATPAGSPVEQQQRFPCWCRCCLFLSGSSSTSRVSRRPLARGLRGRAHLGDPDFTVHGQAFRARRDAVQVRRLARLPGYKTWIAGLSLFLIAAALVVLALTVFKPALLGSRGT